MIFGEQNTELKKVNKRLKKFTVVFLFLFEEYSRWTILTSYEVGYEDRITVRENIAESAVPEMMWRRWGRRLLASIAAYTMRTITYFSMVHLFLKQPTLWILLKQLLENFCWFSFCVPLHKKGQHDDKLI